MLYPLSLFDVLPKFSNVDNNSFSGNMPSAICALRNDATPLPGFLTELWADCGEVVCSCCSKCT